METTRSTPFGKPFVPRERVGHSGQVAGPEKSCNARDVCLEGQRGQVEMQFDMCVEVVWNALRLPDWRYCRRSLRRQLDTAFNFMNLSRKIIDSSAVARSEFLFDGSKFGDHGVQYALTLLPP